MAIYDESLPEILRVSCQIPDKDRRRRKKRDFGRFPGLTQVGQCLWLNLRWLFLVVGIDEIVACSIMA